MEKQRLPFSSTPERGRSTPSTGFPSNSPVSTITPGGSSRPSSRQSRAESRASRASSATPTTSSTSRTTTVSSAFGSEEEVVLKPLKFTKFWQSLKPSKGRLLYFVCSSPDEIQSTVEELINVYEEDTKGVICAILQLFIDLCGNVDIKLSDIYDLKAKSQVQQAREIITLVEQKWEELIAKNDAMKFFFMKKSTVSIALDAALNHFFKCFIVLAYSAQILFDDILMSNVVAFIMQMNSTSHLPIRVTAAILVAKLLICLIELHSSLAKHTNDTSIQQGRFLLKYINELYRMFYENSKLADARASLTKIIECNTVAKCYGLCPNMLHNDKNMMNILIRATKDEDDEVRKEAMSACCKLITSDALISWEQVLQKLFSDVLQRTKDIKISVSEKAIQFFTGAVPTYLKYIDNEHIVTILNFVYCTKWSKARLAGQFIAKYIAARCNGDRKESLRYCASLAFKKKEWADRVSAFVEACIVFLPVLTDLDVIFKLIIEINGDGTNAINTRKNLLHLAHEYARFCLTGRFELPLQIDNVADTPPEIYSQIMEQIVPVLEDLLSIFSEDSNSMIRILNILKWIDVSDCHTEVVYDHCQTAFDILEALLISTSDVKVMEAVTEIIFNFYRQDKLGNNQIENMCNNIITTVLRGLNQLSHGRLSSEMDYLELNRNVKRVSCLYAKFDLTLALKWTDIFAVWTPQNFKIVRFLIMSCQWYLIWSIRNITQEEISDDVNTTRIYNYCKDFVEFCVGFLSGKPNTIQPMIFHKLCDFLLIYNDEFKRKHADFQSAVCLSEENQKRVVNFITVQVFKNVHNLPLNDRRELLCNFFRILHVAFIQLAFGYTILRFYLVNDFHYLFDNFLSNFASQTPLFARVILTVLTDGYEELLGDSPLVNLRTKDAKNLSALSKAFASRQEFTGNACMKIISCVISWVSRSDTYYTFLVMMKEFVNKLGTSEKNDVREVIKSHVPAIDLEKASIRLFLSYLD